jgi:mono/diheme cytochrome c family protein
MRKITRTAPITGLTTIGALVFALGIQSPAQAQEAPYKVDGNKVDLTTLTGYKLYTRERCETCHGQTAEGGGAFPSLVAALKNITKEQFVATVTNGKGAMPAYKDNAKVIGGIDGLYAYVKGRSDGAVPAGKLEELP